MFFHINGSIAFVLGQVIFILIDFFLLLLVPLFIALFFVTAIITTIICIILIYFYYRYYLLYYSYNLIISFYYNSCTSFTFTFYISILFLLVPRCYSFNFFEKKISRGIIQVSEFELHGLLLPFCFDW